MNRDQSLMRRNVFLFALSVAACIVLLAPGQVHPQIDTLASLELHPDQDIYIGRLTLGPVPGAPVEDPLFRPCGEEGLRWLVFGSQDLLASFYAKEGLTRESEIYAAFTAYVLDEWLKEPNPDYVGGYRVVRILALSSSIPKTCL